VREHPVRLRPVRYRPDLRFIFLATNPSGAAMTLAFPTLPPSGPPDFLHQIDSVHRDTMTLLDRPAEALSRQSRPGAWSALQCVEHVTLTNRAYIDLIRASVSETIARGAQARPFTYGIVERLLVWATDPPSHIKVPVPSPSVIPASTTDVAQVRADYDEQYHRFREVIAMAVTTDMLAARLRSPFIHWLTFSVGIGLGVLLAHERRHLYQALRACDPNANPNATRRS
jgi:hypothetical protein